MAGGGTERGRELSDTTAAYGWLGAGPPCYADYVALTLNLERQEERRIEELVEAFRRHRQGGVSWDAIDARVRHPEETERAWFRALRDQEHGRR